jgi:hypothetical protein
LSRSPQCTTVGFVTNHDDSHPIEYHDDDGLADDIKVIELAATMDEIPYVGGPLHGQMARRLPPDVGDGPGWWPLYRTEDGAYMEVLDPEEPGETGYQLCGAVGETRPLAPRDIHYLTLGDYHDVYIQWWHESHPGEPWSATDPNRYDGAD